MIRIFAITFLLFSFWTLEISGQTFSKEYWKEIADDSKASIVGTVEDSFLIIRPDKFKPNLDGSSPNDREFLVGELFRVKD